MSRSSSARSAVWLVVCACACGVEQSVPSAFVGSNAGRQGIDGGADGGRVDGSARDAGFIDGGGLDGAGPDAGVIDAGSECDGLMPSLPLADDPIVMPSRPASIDVIAASGRTVLVNQGRAQIGFPDGGIGTWPGVTSVTQGLAPVISPDVSEFDPVYGVAGGFVALEEFTFQLRRYGLAGDLRSTVGLLDGGYPNWAVLASNRLGQLAVFRSVSDGSTWRNSIEMLDSQGHLSGVLHVFWSGVPQNSYSQPHIVRALGNALSHWLAFVDDGSTSGAAFSEWTDEGGTFLGFGPGAHPGFGGTVTFEGPAMADGDVPFFSYTDPGNYEGTRFSADPLQPGADDLSTLKKMGVDKGLGAVVIRGGRGYAIPNRRIEVYSATGAACGSFELPGGVGGVAKVFPDGTITEFGWPVADGPYNTIDTVYFWPQLLQ